MARTQQTTTLAAQAQSRWPDLEQAWHQKLQAWASSGKLTAAVMKGLNLAATPEEVIQLSQQLSNGTFSALPGVELCPSDTLGTQQAAYGLNTGKIYLNTDWLAAATEDEAIEWLTHELGHHLSHNSGSPEHVNAEAENITSLLLKGKLPPLNTPPGNNPFSFTAANGETVQAEGFGTQMHIDAFSKILPMLNSQALTLITQAQNDTDNWNNASAYAGQYDEFSHFDNGNISASVNYIRLRYQDAVDELYSSAGPLNVEGAKIGRYGSGMTNVFYRFGQITHALQDFYSHSNWIDLIKTDAYPDESASGGIIPLLDGGWGGNFPLINGWQRLTRQLRGESGRITTYDSNVWTLESGLSNYDTPYGSPAWWYLHFDNRGKYAFAAVDKNVKFINPNPGNQDKPFVYGLTTGAVNGAVYDNDKTSWVYDWSESQIITTAFWGASHGGIAGRTRSQSMVYDSYGALAKDATTDKYHQEVFELANKQVVNEFARLIFLLHQKHGPTAVAQFRDFAIKPDQINTFNQQFKQFLPSTTNSTALQKLSSTDDQSAADSGSSSNQKMMQSFGPDELNSLLAPFYPGGKIDVPAINPEWAEPNLYTRLTTEQIQNNLRYIKVFSSEQPGQASLLLQTKDAGGNWVDTEVGGEALRNYDTDFSLAPAATPHWQLGQRGLLQAAAASNGDRKANAFLVESTNPTVQVVINDFDVCSDSIALLDPATGQQQPLGAINLANYTQQKAALLGQHNIVVNAAPELRSQKRALRISPADWAQADGTATGYAIEASDLFFDPDDLSGKTTSTLEFTAYNEAIPWLKLSGGKLIVDPAGLSGQAAPPPGQYSFAVAATDGQSRGDYTQFSLSYNPKVSVGAQAIDAGRQANFRLIKGGASALALYGQIVDASGTAVENARQIVTLLGGSRGGSSSGSGSISDDFCAGTLKFSLRDPATGATIAPLTVTASDSRGFTLSSADGQQLVSATYSSGKSAPRFSQALAEFQTLWGLKLSKPTSDSARNLHSHRVTLGLELSRNDSAAKRVGFYLADAMTGAVLNPRTGAVINALDDARNADQVASYRQAAVDNAVWSTAPANRKAAQMARFTVSSALNWDNLIAVPFINTEHREGGALVRHTYVGNELSNADSHTHMAIVNSSTLGFESSHGGSVNDFKDVLLGLRSVTVS